MKTDAVESGTGDRVGTIRAGFKTHCDHWRDALTLLPVLRKLLLKLLQEVDLVGVHAASRTAPHGDIFDMRIAALQTSIGWTVLRRDTRVQRSHGLRLAPKKGQSAWHRRHEAGRRHFR